MSREEVEANEGGRAGMVSDGMSGRGRGSGKEKWGKMWGPRHRDQGDGECHEKTQEKSKQDDVMHTGVKGAMM